MCDTLFPFKWIKNMPLGNTIWMRELFYGIGRVNYNTKMVFKQKHCHYSFNDIKHINSKCFSQFYLFQPFYIWLTYLLVNFPNPVLFNAKSFFSNENKIRIFNRFYFLTKSSLLILWYWIVFRFERVKNSLTIKFKLAEHTRVW